MANSNTPSTGALTKISFAGTPMGVLRCTLAERQQMLTREGLRGSRSHLDTDQRFGPKRVSGTIEMEPSAAELATIMNYAFGNSGVVSDALLTADILVDKVAPAVANGTGVFAYNACKIDRCVIAATQGQPLRLTLDVVGTTEAGNQTAINAPNSAGYYIHSDVTLTLQNAAREVQGFTLTIDNRIDKERFMNATTLRTLVEQDRVVDLQAIIPWTDATQDLYDQALAGAGGVLALNDGTTAHNFIFGVLQVPPEGVEIPGKSELLLTLNMRAGCSAANTAVKEIAFN